VPVSRRFAYRGVDLLVIPQPDGSVACIPEWMTHEQAAHFKLLAEPSFSLDNLRSMRVEIDVLLAFLSSESTGDRDGHETQTRRYRRSAARTVRPREAEDSDAIANANTATCKAHGSTARRDRRGAGKRGGRQ